MNKPRLFLDIEVFSDYFLALFADENGRGAAIEMYDGLPLDTERLLGILEDERYETQTFNGNGYDMPMLAYAMTGVDCLSLKMASDDIIQGKLKPWDFERKYPQRPFRCDHVDLKSVAPGMVGLKIYGARLHCKQLQELPLHHAASVSPEQRAEVRKYCRNDLRVTKALSDALKEEIDLRRVMNQAMRDDLAKIPHGHLLRFDDLRSKSDAQIAEAVLKQRIFVSTGVIPRKLRDTTVAPFIYTPPAHIKFRTDSLRNALDVIRSSTMVVKSDTGHVIMPKEIEKLDITIGDTSYKIGIGGLHSKESTVARIPAEDEILRDIDVRSYYPQLILNMGMYPVAMGPSFLTEYGSILTERLAAKDAGNKTKDASLKITLNGTFGKTSSKYSILYNPPMMIATTLTGQLDILMLIEALETRGIRVVSANTDGIVVHCKKADEKKLRLIVKAWCQVTRLETEETDYVAMYARDVNSYVAIKPNGKVKTKGAFAIPETNRQRLMKSPQNEVCLHAVVAFLTKGTPLDETIRGWQDISGFVSVRKVNGGAVKDGVDLGGAVRWYYSTTEKGVFTYAESGNAVPRTARAKLANLLPDAIPDDLDFDWYIKEADKLLRDIGALPKIEWPAMPRRGTKLWKEAEALGIVEEDDYGNKQWAVHLDEIPDKYKM